MRNEIRIACSDDVTDLVQLLNQLFSLDLEFEPNTELQEKGLLSIIENPDLGCILVKCLDRRIIGMVSILYSISTALGGKVGVVEDMVIREGFRSKGHGKDLFDSAIKHAKENACLRLTLLTDYNNLTAIEFYKTFGFSKSQMIPMRLLL